MWRLCYPMSSFERCCLCGGAFQQGEVVLHGHTSGQSMHVECGQQVAAVVGPPPPPISTTSTTAPTA